MKASGLSHRDKRALKVLAIALAIAATWLGGSALSARAVPEARIETLEQRYLLARERAARQPALERDARAVRRALGILEARLLSSETPALGQAELRSAVGEFLGSAGIEGATSVFGPLASREGRYVRIPLDLEFACQPAQFVRLMVALANAGPILATRAVEISLAGVAAGFIRVRMTVEGYLPGTIPVRSGNPAALGDVE